MSTLIKEFDLPISLNILYEKFWLNDSFTHEFMTDEMKEMNVSVTEWKQPNESTQLCREVDSMHQLKFAFPGFSALAGVSKESYTLTHYHALICIPLYIVTYSK